MPLPPFPVDDATLDLLDQAARPGPEADRSSVGDLMELITGLAGVADPEEQYHTNDVIAALLAEVRRLRGTPPEPEPGPVGPVEHDGAASLGRRIDRMFAYVALDDTGEGVVGLPVGPGGVPMPLVGADAARMLSYRKAIFMLLRPNGKPINRTIKLLRFDGRHVVEEFTV